MGKGTATGMTEDTAQPKNIGRYEVRSGLGGGGMGDVYRVFDPETRRELALKVLKFSYPRALHYFKREFRAVASLSHPNLVTLYDLHFENEQYFYTMEIVDGTDLYVYVNGHNRIVSDTSVLCAPARLDRIRTNGHPTPEGPCILHHHSRVHRDIKPSNILVDQQGRVSLVDFGIVKELIPGGEGQSLSQVFGTSTYFSPAVFGSNVGPAADLYSVGVVLYELLCGMPPFTGDSVDGLAHRKEPPPSLVQRVPGSSPDLILVCMALLKKDPNAHRLEKPLKCYKLKPISIHRSMNLSVGPSSTTITQCFVGSSKAKAVLFLSRVRAEWAKTALVESFTREARLFGAIFHRYLCATRPCTYAQSGYDSRI